MRGGDNAAAREEHVIENMKRSGVGGEKGGGDDVRGKINMAEETKNNLLRALKISETTNEMGYATIQQLGRQRETIVHAVEGVEETRGELRGARSVIRDIRMGVYKEWAVKGLVLAALVLVDIILFYVKFIRRH